jgi:hypothetical protein
MRQGDG